MSTYYEPEHSVFDQYSFSSGGRIKPRGIAITSSRLLWTTESEPGQAFDVRSVTWSELENIDLRRDRGRLGVRIQLKNSRKIIFDAGEANIDILENLYQKITDILSTVRNEREKRFSQDDMIACLKQMRAARLIDDMEFERIMQRLR